MHEITTSGAELKEFKCKNCKTPIGWTDGVDFFFQVPSGAMCLVALEDIRFLCPNANCKKPIRFQSKKTVAKKDGYTVNL